MMTTQRMRWIVIALILLVAAFPAAAQQAIAIGDRVQGELQDRPVEYSFSANAGDLIVATLESADFDALLVLADASGQEIARDDDSGGSGNSRLSYMITASGSYRLLAQGYDSAASGAFTLALTSLTPVELTTGKPVAVQMESGLPPVLIFSARAGEVLDLIAVSAQDDDVRLGVKGPDGYEIASDDDGGPGVSAYLRGFVVPSDGAYLVEITSPLGQELTGVVTVTARPAELLALTAEPQIITLGAEYDKEVLSFEAQAGIVYRLVIRPAGSTEAVDVSVYFRRSDEQFFGANATFSALAAASLDYRAQTDGLHFVEVQDYSYGFDDQAATYEIALVVVE